MKFTSYKYDKDDTFYQATSKGYKNAKDYRGIPGGISGLGQYANNNRLRAGLVVGALVVAALTATYFMYPAYTALVNTTVAKIAASVSSAVTGLTTLAAANPLAAGLIMIAALVTIGALAYMTYSKSSQINGVKEEVLKACEKDGDKPKIDDGKLKPNGDASTFLNGVAVAVGLAPAQAK